MEIIIKAFKETILTFSWGEVVSAIVITVLCFGLMEFIARMKYKDYLKKQDKEKEAVGSHFYNRLVGRDILADKTLSYYRSETLNSFFAIVVLLFYVFVIFLLLGIALILVVS
ncbi:hypothetical protein [Streptococcus gallolyticus]|uniref:Uncharacterized protein n=1 Tax=Streptococcus gallolyticus TaxID=315405 RepID=A0A1H9PBP1_9STRE|nr:hypothetical protein [Streptococcus gallolyticus]SER45552.1 hypothetical protein SAMN04487840_10463 [Streptococcus gallolyticus]